ncbi:MAG TPA: hypothetical protein VF669_01925 [Tepidisphaeraceae bacterium]|jgi:hypothetical protein
MDVGMTKSGRNSPFHFVTGTIVFFATYSAALMMVRHWLIQ